ncbi:MAG: hypothetical protein ACJ749_17440 [Flavisolibacter sp.]
MATTTYQQTIASNYTERISKPSVFSKFIKWCENQQENRLLWLGIALAGHGCIITPLTVMAVMLAGTNLSLFMLALVSMSIAVVTNLAALPTKITIPALVFTILLDLGIIISAAVHGFNLANTF